MARQLGPDDGNVGGTPIGSLFDVICPDQGGVIEDRSKKNGQAADVIDRKAGEPHRGNALSQGGLRHLGTGRQRVPRVFGRFSLARGT